MPADRTTGVINLYFGTKERCFHFLFKAVLILTITQQIYFPQEMKYFHLALIVMYMVFKSIFTVPFQGLGEQAAFLISVTFCALISVLQHTGILESGMLYLAGLIMADFLALRLMVRLFNAARTQAPTKGESSQHQLASARDRGFLLILTGLITVILILSMGYQGYKLLTLWL